MKEPSVLKSSRPLGAVVSSREFQHPVGDFLYRLGANVYEALIRKWRTQEQLTVDPGEFLPVPISAGPGLVHHSPSEFRLVDYAQRCDHEIEVPEHAAQVLYALVFQVGNNDEDYLKVLSLIAAPA